MNEKRRSMNRATEYGRDGSDTSDSLTEEERGAPIDLNDKEVEETKKKRGRPRGSKNRCGKEEAKYGTRKIEDMVDRFCRKDRVTRSPFKIHEEQESKEKKEREEEKRNRTEKEGVGEQNKILEFLKEQNRNMDENLRGLKDAMMTSIKEESTNTREIFTKEITEIKKNLERKEKEWLLEKKLMQVRIETLEEKMATLEIKIEEKKIENQITSEIDKRLKDGSRIPEIQKEEKWLRKLEEKVEKMVKGKGREEIERLESIDQKLERNERASRRVNLIIRGLEFEGRNLRREVEEFLETKLEAKEKVRRATRLGKNVNNNNNGVLVQMETLEAKRRIMRNRKLLKGSRIFVDDDLTKAEREVHIRIWNQAKKEEAKGNRVKRGYMKLIIDGVCWRWNERSDRLEKQNF